MPLEHSDINFLSTLLQCNVVLVLHVSQSHVFSYHCAIDRQRAIVQLTDAVADLDVYSIFAPPDGGQGVSPNLTVQDGITTQRFNTVGVKVSINDRRLWRQTEQCALTL